MTAPATSIIDACGDRELFAPWFRDRKTMGGLVFICSRSFRLAGERG
jgi:hypothetical protein